MKRLLFLLLYDCLSAAQFQRLKQYRLCGACAVVAVACLRSVSEQKRNAPQSRQSNENIYDPAYDTGLSSEEEADYIKLKQSDAAPVDTAYDQQR